MALHPILQNWRNSIQNLEEPTIDSIKQITEITQGQIAVELGVDLQQLAAMAAYLNSVHLQQVFQRFVQNEVADGVENQGQARANAATRLRDSIKVLLTDILGANNDMPMDGGRRRRSKKTRRTRRR
jgi:hypothetical protein